MTGPRRVGTRWRRVVFRRRRVAIGWRLTVFGAAAHQDRARGDHNRGVTTPAYGAERASAPITPLTIERRAVGPKDVGIEILFCGICHSDLHQVREEWGGGIFPMVPGHEIVGRSRASATR